MYTAQNEAPLNEKKLAIRCMFQLSAANSVSAGAFPQTPPDGGNLQSFLDPVASTSGGKGTGGEKNG